MRIRRLGSMAATVFSSSSPTSLVRNQAFDSTSFSSLISYKVIRSGFLFKEPMFRGFRSFASSAHSVDRIIVQNPIVEMDGHYMRFHLLSPLFGSIFIDKCFFPFFFRRRDDENYLEDDKRQGGILIHSVYLSISQ